MCLCSYIIQNIYIYAHMGQKNEKMGQKKRTFSRPFENLLF